MFSMEDNSSVEHNSCSDLRFVLYGSIVVAGCVHAVLNVAQKCFVTISMDLFDRVGGYLRIDESCYYF